MYGRRNTRKKWRNKLLEFAVNGKIPKEHVAEGYTFFTTEPKLVEYHKDILMKELGEPKEEYDAKTVIKTMIDIDINSFKIKIKDSFKYFEENNEEIICKIIFLVPKLFTF